MTASLADRLLGSPRLYDRVQAIFGLDELRRRVMPAVARLEPGKLLDVGAGTGNFYSIIPNSFEYIGLDPDERKLVRFREKFAGVRTVRGSGTELPFDDAEVDYTLCIDVSHHLVDDDLGRLVDELARVTRKKLIFVDALKVPRFASTVLWAIDRGSHPRPLDALLTALQRRFEFDVFEVFAIHHVYLMAVGRVVRPDANA
jgi:ubiquinone/menaquinone biosynthesis C-methylase UbiE